MVVRSFNSWSLSQMNVPQRLDVEKRFILKAHVLLLGALIVNEFAQIQSFLEGGQRTWSVSFRKPTISWLRLLIPFVFEDGFKVLQRSVLLVNVRIVSCAFEASKNQQGESRLSIRDLRFVWWFVNGERVVEV